MCGVCLLSNQITVFSGADPVAVFACPTCPPGVYWGAALLSVYTRGFEYSEFTGFTDLLPGTV